jgi:hypothetical protein
MSSDSATVPAAPLPSDAVRHRRTALEDLYHQGLRDLEAMRARLTARRLALGLPPAPRT